MGIEPIGTKEQLKQKSVERRENERQSAVHLNTAKDEEVKKIEQQETEKGRSLDTKA